MPAPKRKINGEKRHCLTCGKEFTYREKYHHRQSFCSILCANKDPNKNHANSGRPPKIDPNKPILENEVVQKLVEAFKLDCTIEEACAYAKISKGTYFTYLNNNPDFLEQIESARQYLKILARQTIATSIQEGDRDNAKWYLERKIKKEFSTRQELTGEEGEPIKTQVHFYLPDNGRDKNI